MFQEVTIDYITNHENTLNSRFVLTLKSEETRKKKKKKTCCTRSLWHRKTSSHTWQHYSQTFIPFYHTMLRYNYWIYPLDTICRLCLHAKRISIDKAHLSTPSKNIELDWHAVETEQILSGLKYFDDYWYDILKKNLKNNLRLRYTSIDNSFLFLILCYVLVC